MTQTDDIILEYLSQIPSAEPPAVILWNIHDRADEFRLDDRVRGGSFTKTTLQNRLKNLESAGLVENVEATEGFRRLTEDGQRYLAGDLDVSDVDL